MLPTFLERAPRLVFMVAPAFVVAAVAFGGLTARAFAQTNEPGARYSVVAMDLERGGSFQLVIVVNRWTSQAEYDRLMNVMFDQGPDALLQALQRTPRVGYIQNPPEIGWPVFLARRTPGEDGGEQVFLLTDRQLNFNESTGRQRSGDYPFTVIEMQLKANGEGQGSISLATKLIPDKQRKMLVLENYDLQRIRLSQVRRTSPAR
jgi:hypothetical protein